MLKGNHIVFYYYGNLHLNIGLNFFMNHAASNHHYLYLCTDNLSVLNNYKLNNSNHLAVEELFPSKNTAFKENVYSIIDFHQNNNYSGVSFVIDASYILKKLSENQFLQFEKSLTKVISHTPCSFLCLYNFEDFLKDQVFINHKMVKNSLRLHSHKLNTDTIVRLNQFYHPTLMI